MGITQTKEEIVEQKEAIKSETTKIKSTHDLHMEALKIHSKLKNLDFIFNQEKVKNEVQNKRKMNLSRLGKVLIDPNQNFENYISINFEEISVELTELILSYSHFLLKPNGVPLFPKEIPNLKNLKILNLTSCSLNDVPFISKIESLENLNLSYNDFLKIPDEVLKLKSLKILDIGFNPMNQISFDIINLKELEELNMNHLSIYQIPDLSDLTKLKKLSAQLSPLLTQKLISFPKLPSSLEYLDLRYSKLNDFPDLSDLSNIIELDLGFGNFQTINESISKLDKLEKLNLFSHKLTSLPELPRKLKNLIIRKNKFEEFPNQILLLNELEVLDISFNLMKDIPSLDNLAKLKTFDISFSKVEKLSKIPESLEELIAENTIINSKYFKKNLDFTNFNKLSTKEKLIDRIKGCLYGQAIADAYGLATEFLNKEQSHLFYGCEEIEPTIYLQDRHRKNFTLGDFTDDVSRFSNI